MGRVCEQPRKKKEKKKESIGSLDTALLTPLGTDVDKQERGS